MIPHYHTDFSHRHQFERRAQHMPMQAQPTRLRKRDIVGGVLASVVFLVAIWAALVMLP